MKTCEWCGAEFEHRKAGAPKRFCSHRCQFTNRNHKNREKIRAYDRARHARLYRSDPCFTANCRRAYWAAAIKKRYGLTVEDFARMLHQQGFGCAICGDNGELSVDHCHDTGRVRGLLCRKCNWAIGALPVHHMKAAAEYVLA